MKRKSGDVWEWIQGCGINGGRNIKLHQAEFTAMSPLSEDSRFNVEAHSFKR